MLPFVLKCCQIGLLDDDDDDINDDKIITVIENNVLKFMKKLKRKSRNRDQHQ